MEDGQKAKFQKEILDWYRNHGRALPWRRNPTPYRIWISEIMLQQTQVKTAVPYYERFLARFPDVVSLAHASEPEVLALWSGLGYYARARNLRKAARHIVGTYGSFPVDFEAILALPGIGRYTAGAICAIAYNQPRPAVDGNIRRVIARLTALRGAEGRYYRQMNSLIPHGEASTFTQAMMDLGAMICTPLRPACLRCPAGEFCRAKKLGIQDQFPPRRARQACRQIRIAALLLERRNRILLVFPVRPAFIPGKYGLPARLLSDSENPKEAAVRLCRKVIGRAIPLSSCALFRHAIGRRQIVVHGYRGKTSIPLPCPDEPGNCRWAERSSVGKLLTSSLYKKMLQKDAKP